MTIVQTPPEQKVCPECGDPVEGTVTYHPTCCAHPTRAIDTEDISDGSEDEVGGSYIHRFVSTCTDCGGTVEPDEEGYPVLV